MFNPWRPAFSPLALLCTRRPAAPFTLSANWRQPAGIRLLGWLIGLWLIGALPPTPLLADASRQPDLKQLNDRADWQVQDVTTGVTAADLALRLVGPGVTLQEAVYQGAPTAAGLFEGGEAALGFASGVVLSSGLAHSIVGPNESDSVSFSHAWPGDADLALLTPHPLHDAAALSLTFIPDAPRLHLSYVWGSDEYNEFVFTAFADLMGIFINGENVAWLDGQPLSVDAVNGGNPYATLPHARPELYRNNDLDDGGGQLDIEADGLTLLLRLVVDVTPHQINHLKIVLADAGDTLLDSFVLLPEGSLTTAQPTSVELLNRVDRPGRPIGRLIGLSLMTAGVRLLLFHWQRQRFIRTRKPVGRP